MHQRIQITRGRNFNPRSPCGERPRRVPRSTARSSFQSTLPVRGATWTATRKTTSTTFQSTLPVRGATAIWRARKWRIIIFQSTLPVRGATYVDRIADPAIFISIHAPRAGSDFSARLVQLPTGISIHAPRAGSDNERLTACRSSYRFQSTLPVRGATHGAAYGAHNGGHFNPRSPCGERPFCAR